MGKLRNFLVCIAAFCCPILIGTDNAVGAALREAAYLSAGVSLSNSSSSKSDKPDIPEIPEIQDNSEYPASYSQQSSSQSSSSNNAPENPDILGTVIRLNETELTDETDYSVFTENSGKIYRMNYGKYSSENYINLKSGAQIRNCTSISNEVLEAAAEKLPELGGNYDPAEPQVLIYHTHTTESFLPKADSYDEKYPTRSFSDKRNMTAVGDALCNALAKRGISSVHDCKVHDYPSFNDAYSVSAETVKRDLEQYPSIKIVIDLHRDAIISTDGSLPAPVAEINGKNAAQFMIISGCDNGTFDMPDYMENFKLACLLQNCAETAYPSLARPVLFDYRCYNQNLSTGALLIEVGSHGNSLDEALYTGELLGNVIADAVGS